MTHILLVCLANICRSPMAQSVTEAIARSLATRPAPHVESAGIHVLRGGAPPDPRALAALNRRGYAWGGTRSRELQAEDFERFDLILAMDRSVLTELVRLCPFEHQHKLGLFLDFAAGFRGQEVPDPYFGGEQGFENVLDLCEAGARGLLSEVDRRAAP